ncbi:major royal jelly protein 1-like [Neodiprion fabricii]|uniref:major royal jelly protein 1-like n=1 Tax=Neodiprion fabricii TaxID=2872261 RepID=UPI001ED981AF|nr:major royal jelly protein 1-like [Neodiprion fabricii]
MNLILTGILAFAAWTSAVELDTVYTWKYLDYVWPNDSCKEDAISAGQYNASTTIPADLQPIGDYVFVSIPRKANNPASLVKVSNETGDGGPLLEPYPSWDWHTSDDCSGITSVSRLATDDCDRLWIVDSGKIGTEQVCDAQIIVFDPETDEVLLREEIPSTLAHHSTNTSRGRLEIQAVKTEGDSCENVTVLIGDPEGYGVVVYDGDNMWRVENDVIFSPNLTQATASQLPQVETDNYGVSNIDIMPPSFVEEIYVTLNPLLSNDYFAVRLSELMVEDGDLTWYKSNYTSGTNVVVSRVMTKSGVLIDGHAYWPNCSCWNNRYPTSVPEGQNVTWTNITGNPYETYTIGTKIREGPDGETDFSDEEYWQLTSLQSIFNLRSVDVDVVNFAISYGNVGYLIDGTVCDLLDPQSYNRTIEDTYMFEFDG